MFYRIGNALGTVDDYIQQGFRNAYGLGVFGGAGDVAADVLHIPRQKYRDDLSGRIGLIGSRAAQAGAVTAAGAGLYELTGAMNRAFGSAADYPTDAQAPF